MTETDPLSSTATVTEPGPLVNQPTARRDFALLWTGQSLSLLGDQFMVLALPLLAVTVLGATAAQAALLPFALFLPFLFLGLPAGAIIDRRRRLLVVIICNAVQAVAFAAIAVLAWQQALPFGLLLVIVGIAGCAVVFFEVAYTSYLPHLFNDPRDLQRGNARLYFSESVARSVGPMLAGPIIAFLGVVTAVAANAVSFVVSVVSLLSIKSKEPKPEPQPRRPYWLYHDMREGLRFVFSNPLLEPVITCGMVYVLFLTAVDATLVLYCREVLGLGPVGIGVVIGAAALGFPIGNLLSGRLVDRMGMPRTLVAGACVSVAGLVVMPVAGSLGSVVGLVSGSILHGMGEGAFGPTSLTLRQTVTPNGLLGRVNSVQRFAIWGTIPLGSLLAAGSIAVAGLQAALWVGGLGTLLCLVPLLRRGILADLRTPRVAAGQGA